ncbi:peptidylprolyl isomerase [Simiduia agarivorans]|uniref:peptidylprolyl isomerase n=1 Tax=Simiduia agarivorans (strain DSM 21679 / JCM 13881 / BCRC 17597 / SA1) TaxID=1117647 RepID=K4L288_SIMAS|nr:peptidylprolyl isomerase [Simiduia agarivorans]AFV00293.1 peptidylprolyl isomerase [Simiduia agarivorans SA1 = DSM 21679]
MIRVNQTEISENAILAEMQYHPAENQRDAMIRASEALIIGELVKARAQALGITLEADADNEEALEALLAKEAITPSATAEDCERYYQANLDKFQTTPLLAVRHILLAAAPDDDDARIAAADKAIAIIDQLSQAPASFAALAEAHSACPSAKLGGNLGQITRGQTVPEFERQLLKLQPGLARRPLESRYGLHVVSVDQRAEGRQLTYEQVEDRIREYLNEKVRRKAIAQYIQTLIADASIEGFDFSVSESPLLQ